MSLTARCSRCKNEVSVWAYRPTSKNYAARSCEKIYVYPSVASNHALVDGSEVLPDHIMRAYKDTVTVYNTGVWSATATLCRRTLEGIVKDLRSHNGNKDDELTKSNQNLFDALEELSKSVELNKPLITLSHSIRKAGNLGAHFDLDKEPDEKMVQAMLELIEYLLTYVYTLPGKIESLNSHVEELGRRESETTEEK